MRTMQDLKREMEIALNIEKRSESEQIEHFKELMSRVIKNEELSFVERQTLSMLSKKFVG